MVAVGSRSVESAQKFVEKHAPSTTTKAYGSYAEVYADPVNGILFSSGYKLLTMALQER